MTSSGDERSADGALVKTIIVRTTPTRLFAFFTDPDAMRLWIGTDIEIDPRPGGTFRVVPNRSDVIVGKYVEVDPPSRVVFTWGFDGEGQALPAGGSLVEITLTPVPEGTELRLVHRALPASMRDPHAHGWDHYLARIAAAAVGHEPGPDPLANPAIRHGAPHSPLR